MRNPAKCRFLSGFPYRTFDVSPRNRGKSPDFFAQSGSFVQKIIKYFAFSGLPYGKIRGSDGKIPAPKKKFQAPEFFFRGLKFFRRASTPFFSSALSFFAYKSQESFCRKNPFPAFTPCEFPRRTARRRGSMKAKRSVCWIFDFRIPRENAFFATCPGRGPVETILGKAGMTLCQIRLQNDKMSIRNASCSRSPFFEDAAQSQKFERIPIVSKNILNDSAVSGKKSYFCENKQSK